MQQLYLNNFFYKDPTTGEFIPIAAIAGESAYEIAIRLGTFTGTEEEWNNYIAIERDKAIADIVAKAAEAKASIPEEYTALAEAMDGKFDKTNIAQGLGDDPNKVLSQKAATANFKRFATYNLLNDLEIEKDKCLTTSDGIPQENGNGWAVTGHIPVEAGKTYTINWYAQNYNYAYDENGNATNIPMDSFTKFTEYEGYPYFRFTIPENCTTVRLSFKYIERPDLDVMLYENEDGAIKPFVDFMAVSSETLATNSVTTKKIKDGAITPEKLSFSLASEIEKSRVVKDAMYDENTRIIGEAVKELYIPDDACKGVLTFSVLKKSINTDGIIRLYDHRDLTKPIYDTKAVLTVCGEQMIELTNPNGEFGYIVIDWDKVPDGTSISGKVTEPYIVSDSAYYLDNSPRIKAMIVKKDKVFFDDEYNDVTSVISSAVLALYVGDNSYRGNLRFCVIRKDAGIVGAMRFYAYINDALTLVYDTDKQTDLTGIKIVEMRHCLGGEPAYIVVDWDKVPDETNLTGKIGSEMILNDTVYEKDSFEKIQLAMAVKSTEKNIYASGNLTMFADKFRGGEVETNLLKFHRNFNMPKKGLFFSTDVEYYKGLDGNTTDEERIKGLIPYLYFNGKKIGTVVLYDETTGAPFVYLEDGTKKILS